MKKACCFTNFKLSHAHVIHIYNKVKVDKLIEG